MFGGFQNATGDHPVSAHASQHGRPDMLCCEMFCCAVLGPSCAPPFADCVSAFHTSLPTVCWLQYALGSFLLEELNKQVPGAGEGCAQASRCLHT